MKLSSILLASTLALAFVNSASAANGMKGKCAKQALEAAVTKWADVPNPSETLEYFPLSSEVTAKPDTYIVVLGLSDGNESTYAKYKVVFGEPSSCKKPVATAAN